MARNPKTRVTVGVVLVLAVATGVWLRKPIHSSIGVAPAGINVMKGEAQNVPMTLTLRQAHHYVTQYEGAARQTIQRTVAN